jgi:hypothetical protein
MLHFSTWSISSAQTALDGSTCKLTHEREGLLFLVDNGNDQDIRHYGGCEAIQDVRISSVDGEDRVDITVDENLYESLNETRVSEKSLVAGTTKTEKISVGIGEYQIWRMSDAYNSIGLSGKDENGKIKPISIYVNEKLWQPKIVGGESDGK